MAVDQIDPVMGGQLAGVLRMAVLAQIAGVSVEMLLLLTQNLLAQPGVLGRAFAEAGTLSNPDVSGANLLDSKDPRFSIGVGLSWGSPFGPIRVDLAWAVIKENFDKDEIFRFSFGTRF